MLAAVVIMGKIRAMFPQRAGWLCKTANRAHRGKRVHALGPRGAWHELHGKSGDACFCDLLNYFRGTQRAQESDDGLSTAHEREVGLASDVVELVTTQDLQHDVGGAEHGSAIGNNLRALFGIDRVRVASLVAGSSLYDDLEPGLQKVGNDHGNERNPAFAGITFFRNSNNHAALVLSPTLLRKKKGTKNSNRSWGNWKVRGDCDAMCGNTVTLAFCRLARVAAGRRYDSRRDGGATF